MRKTIMTRNIMIPRECVAPSAAVEGATHILLRIPAFASSPAKARTQRRRQTTLGSHVRGNDDIGDVMDFRNAQEQAAAPSIARDPRVRRSVATCYNRLGHPRFPFVFCPHD